MTYNIKVSTNLYMEDLPYEPDEDDVRAYMDDLLSSKELTSRDFDIELIEEEV